MFRTAVPCSPAGCGANSERCCTDTVATSLWCKGFVVEINETRRAEEEMACMSHRAAPLVEAVSPARGWLRWAFFGGWMDFKFWFLHWNSTLKLCLLRLYKYELSTVVFLGNWWVKLLSIICTVFCWNVLGCVFVCLFAVYIQCSSKPWFLGSALRVLIIL